MQRILSVSICLLLIWGAVFCAANDGRDRYSGPVVLYHLYAPVSEKAGFTVLEEDLAGGADGAPVYRWARAEVNAVIKLIAAETYKQWGKAAYPLAIFDMTAENGDTPIEWDEDSHPSGRHPGNSHDGGVNPDLGYYMTSLKGKIEDPDYSVCDEHYSLTDKDDEGNPKDLYQCAGEPNRLDIDRQAYFFLRLFQMHADPFNHQLLEAIGIDHYIKRAVLEKLANWRELGRFGVTDDLIDEVERILTDDRWGGWARFHHHHIHMRFRELDEGGPYRAALYDLFRKERALELELQRAEHPDGTLFLKTNLISYKMRRSIDVTLLVELPETVTTCEYRIASGEWVAADVAENNFRYVFDLPYRPRLTDSKVTIEARVGLAEGELITISSDVYLPALNPMQLISVDRAAIHADYRIVQSNEGETWLFSLNFPAIYSHYLTRANYRVFFSDETLDPVSIDGQGHSFEASFVNQESRDILSIEVRVYLSRRVVHTIPVFVAPLIDKQAVQE